MSDNPFENADVIHAYTRAQALADGELVDITETAARFGFAYPVAVTRAVWAGILSAPSEPTRRLNARLLLNAAVEHARTGPRSDRRAFTYTDPATGETVALVMRCGPGDDAEPVVTIMTPLDD